MDIVVVLFVAGLSAATWGLLRFCEHLGNVK